MKNSTLLRWEFMRGGERLICQVDHEPDRVDAGTFAVTVMPYRHLQRASIENFQAAAAALRRHATVASGLRARGWKLVAYTS